MMNLNRRRLALNGSRILLLGLAYKRNTGDARESPAVVVADRLLALGAEVRAVDPHVVEGHVSERVARVECSAEEVAGADLVVLLTDHDVVDYDVVLAEAKAVFDTRRRLSGDRVEHL